MPQIFIRSVLSPLVLEACASLWAAVFKATAKLKNRDWVRTRLNSCSSLECASLLESFLINFERSYEFESESFDSSFPAIVGDTFWSYQLFPISHCRHLWFHVSVWTSYFRVSNFQHIFQFSSYIFLLKYKSFLLYLRVNSLDPSRCVCLCVCMCVCVCIKQYFFLLLHLCQVIKMFITFYYDYNIIVNITTVQ